jgi:hypothetical protein
MMMAGAEEEEAGAPAAQFRIENQEVSFVGARMSHLQLLRERMPVAGGAACSGARAAGAVVLVLLVQVPALVPE